MIGSGAIVVALSYVESERILQDVGLAAIRLFGVAIAIFVGIQLVYREVERRTVYTILSKPISRARVPARQVRRAHAHDLDADGVHGRRLRGASRWPPARRSAWQHLAFVLLVAAELALVVALATLFSASPRRCSRRFFTDGLWVVGQLSRDLRDLGARVGRRRRCAARHRGCSSACCPTCESFDLAVEAAHLLPVTRVGRACCRWSTAFGYTTLVLLARGRDLRAPRLPLRHAALLTARRYAPWRSSPRRPARCSALRAAARPGDRLVPQRRDPPAAARRVDRRSPGSHCPPAARRCAGSTTCRCSRGCGCAAAAAAARARISWRYPAVELATGLLFAAIAWRHGLARR